MQIERDRRFSAAEQTEQILYVQSPAVATRAALGFDSVAADVYWIRAIQYYGRARLLRSEAAQYDLLYPLLDLTTSLDPQFSVAYRFGAFFLSERPPGGAGRPDLAIRLLEKAIAANPSRWEYPYDIGFVHYRMADFAKAADWFSRASTIPGSADWLPRLAAVTLATGGDVRSSRLIWENLLATGEEGFVRREAQRRLVELDAIEEVLRLRALTQEYERRHGDPPATWEDMIRDGALRRVPTDPAGFPYALNPWWGFVSVDERSPMWPLALDNPK